MSETVIFLSIKLLSFVHQKNSLFPSSSTIVYILPPPCSMTASLGQPLCLSSWDPLHYLCGSILTLCSHTQNVCAFNGSTAFLPHTMQRMVIFWRSSYSCSISHVPRNSFIRESPLSFVPICIAKKILVCFLTLYLLNPGVRKWWGRSRNAKKKEKEKNETKKHEAILDWLPITAIGNPKIKVQRMRLLSGWMASHRLNEHEFE